MFKIALKLKRMSRYTAVDSIITLLCSELTSIPTEIFLLLPKGRDVIYGTSLFYSNQLMYLVTHVFAGSRRMNNFSNSSRREYIH